MAVIVQKYGGTSVGTTGRIRAVADRVVAARQGGHDVVVVVSAMGDSTDDLLAMAHEVTPAPNPRELDMLLTAGERIAMSLLAIALNAFWGLLGHLQFGTLDVPLTAVFVVGGLLGLVLGDVIGPRKVRG